MKHEVYMSRCLELAKKGELYVAPNPMVGAVLVGPDGQILAEGWHRQFGGPHAEVEAFRQYDDKKERGLLPAHSLSDCTLYVSLEPCSHYGKTPPCADMICRRGVGRVVVGCLDCNPEVRGNGIRKLEQAGIEVIVGVMEDECRWLNRRFFCLMEKHRPYVILKWAQTADGFLAPLSDEEREGGVARSEQKRLVISTPETKQLVHRMRAENMAIMVGTNTVVKDNPRLLTTHWSGRHPLRVTLDRHSRLSNEMNIFSSDAPTLVFTDDTTFRHVLQELAERHIHSLLVEGGGELLTHILRSGLWDEAHIEVGPQLIGNGIAAPEIKMPAEPYMSIDGQKLYCIYHEDEDDK